MSLLLLAPTVGATAGSIADGTATSMLQKDSKVNLFLLDESLSRGMQRTIMFTATDPSVSTSGANGYTQARSKFVIQSPKLLANNVVTKNSVEFKIMIDPETTAAEIQELKMLCASVLLSGSADSFFNSQVTG